MREPSEFKSTDGAILRYQTEGKGPLVVALHGFPDTFRTWDVMSAELVATGFQVVALAMRGYAPSEVPWNGDYSLRRLAQDVEDLLDHLEADTAILIGHDWGASTAYALAAISPERVSAIAAFAIPPLAVGPNGLCERWARPHNLYLGFGALSDWWLRRKGFQEVKRLYRLWSPSWQVSEDHIETVLTALQPRERSRAAVEYYRLGKTGQSELNLAVPISTPTVIVYGEDEPEIRKLAFEQAHAVIGPGSQVIMIEGVGHWPHLEAPEKCLSLVISFLGQKLSH